MGWQARGKDTFLEEPAGRPDQFACFRPPFISAAWHGPSGGGVSDSLDDEAKAAFRAGVVKRGVAAYVYSQPSEGLHGMHAKAPLRA